jgi:hypothetical protein
VKYIGREPQHVPSTWDQYCLHGSIGIKILYHSIQQRQSLSAMIMDNFESNRLCEFLIDLFYQEWEPKVAYSNNHSCIELFENPLLHKNSMNIEIMYHSIHDKNLKGEIKLQYISIDEKVAKM